jgi:hypothetical protein
VDQVSVRVDKQLQDENARLKKLVAELSLDKAIPQDIAVKRLRAKDVVSVLNRLVARRRAPTFLFADNGSAFSGRLLDMWAYHYRVQIDVSRPGKPTDNQLHRDVQWIVQGRMSEFAVVRIACRGQARDRSMAPRLQ